MSKHDLGSGTRWADALAQELEASSFGIVCLTPENVAEPWILFEAGALTKHVKDRACCLLIGDLRPADISGPLAQFQNRRFERTDVRKLLSDINSMLNRPLDLSSLDLVFDKLWPDLEREVSSATQAAAAQGQHKSVKRDSYDLLEEILLGVRGLRTVIERRAWLTSPRMPRGAIIMLAAELRDLPPPQLEALEELSTSPRLRDTTLFHIQHRFGENTIDELIKAGFISVEGSYFSVAPTITEFFGGMRMLHDPETA